MTAAPLKTPPFKFTVNQSVPCVIRSVKVYPNKAWEGKMLPPQVSIRGVFGGTEGSAYLPGPAWKNLNALEAAGIIGKSPEEARGDVVTAAVMIPVLEGRVIAMLRKLAGEKWETMVYEVDEHLISRPVSKRLTSADAASGDLPGDPASDHNRPAVVVADAPEPEEVDAATAARRRSYAANKALWRDVADFQREVCEGKDGQERIPYDASSINALVAVVTIQWEKLGLAVR